MSKIIQSGGFIGALLGKLSGPLMEIAIPFTKYVLEPLATMALASEIDSAIQREMHGRGVLRATKEITLVISNKDMDDIIKIRCIDLQS